MPLKKRPKSHEKQDYIRPKQETVTSGLAIDYRGEKEAQTGAAS